MMTGSIKTAALIGSAEVSMKILLYWAHERVWSRIAWGRVHHVISLDRVGPTQSPPADTFPAMREHANGGADPGHGAPLPVRFEMTVQKSTPSRDA